MSGDNLSMIIMIMIIIILIIVLIIRVFFLGCTLFPKHGALLRQTGHRKGQDYKVVAILVEIILIFEHANTHTHTHTHMDVYIYNLFS